jgi:hypothetical protein
MISLNFEGRGEKIEKKKKEKSIVSDKLCHICRHALSKQEEDVVRIPTTR